MNTSSSAEVKVFRRLTSFKCQMCDVFPYRNPVMEEHSVGPRSPSFHQQNKHFGSMWKSCHEKHLCHGQAQPLLTDLWVIHLPLLPTAPPLRHSPSCYNLGTQRLEMHDQPATESHPLEVPLPSKAFQFHTTAQARHRGQPSAIGLVLFGFTSSFGTMNLCLHFLPVFVLLQKQV